MITQYNILCTESYYDRSTIYFETECDNFKKILEATSILNENSILIEAIDFKAISGKLKHIWESFKKWFKTHVIDKLKALYQKIVSSRLANAIKKIPSSTYGKFNDIKFRLKNGKYVPEDVNFDDAEDAKNFDTLDSLDDKDINEACNKILSEAVSEKESKIVAMIGALIKPAIFFNIHNYVDTGKLVSAFKIFEKVGEKAIDILNKAGDNSKDSLSDLRQNIDYNTEDESDEAFDMIEDAFKIQLSDMDDYDSISANEIKSAINKDLQSKMKSNLTLREVLDIIKTNQDSTKDCMDLFRSMSNSINSSIEKFNSVLDKIFTNIGVSKNTNKFEYLLSTIKELEKASLFIMVLEDYCMYNYTLSAGIGEAIDRLAEIL